MRSTLLITLVVILLGGCQSLPSQPAFSSYLVLPKTSGGAAYTNPQYTSDVVQAEPASCTGIPAPVIPAARNACIVDLMTDIDAAYFNYEIAVNNAISRTNAALSIAQSAFSISGTAAGGTASTVLNSLGTFTGGVKTTISDELLYKTTIQILISTMQADRAKQAAQIRLSMQLDTTAYTMNQAHNDLLAYFYAGTVTHALAEANNNAAAVAQKCQAVDKAVKAAVSQGATAKAVNGDGVATAQSTPNSAATTTSDQCNQIADSITFKFDASQPAMDALKFLAPSGKYDKNAAASVVACLKTTPAPPGFQADKYKLPNGAYDLGSLLGDAAVDKTYKAGLIACAKANPVKPAAAPAATHKAKSGAKAAPPRKGATKPKAKSPH